MNLTHPAIVTQGMTTDACPVQIMGELVDGRKFYFRFRSGRAQLGIGYTLDGAVADSLNESNATVVDENDRMRGFFYDSAEANAVFNLLYGMRE